MSNYTELYIKRKEKNLCVRCGKNPPIAEEIKCETCKSRDKLIQDKNNSTERDRNYRRNKVDNGLCYRCSNFREQKDKTLCNKCLLKNNENHKIYYYENAGEISEIRKENRSELIKLGICVICSKQPADNFFVSCADCRKIKALNSRERRKYLRENGLCWCGNIAIKNFTQCRECKDKFKEKYYNLILNGFCPCGEINKDLTHTYCLKCRNFFQELSANRRYKNKELGLCGCGAITLDGKHSCQFCLESSKTYNLNLKLEILFHYSSGIPHCECCDENLLDFLTLDHIKKMEPIIEDFWGIIQLAIPYI